MDYLNSKIKAKCPVCSRLEGNLIYEVNIYEASQHYIRKEVDKERYFKLAKKIKDLWGSNNCKIVKCKNCGFIYANPYVSGDAEFYELAYNRSSYPKDKWEYVVTKEAIKRVLKEETVNDIKLLEVGAGDGQFIDKIRSILPTNNITATEFSSYGIRQLKDKCNTVLNIDIRDIEEDKYSSYFDVICMFQVLEHMDNLDILFKKINKLTKNKALLFISVPNDERIEFNEKNGALLDMPPNHIGRWNENSFKIIASKYGWIVKEYKKEPFSISESYKQFVIYKYVKESQKHDSIANHIEKIRVKGIKKVFKIICAFFISINCVYLIPKMLKEKNGNSQWILLSKI